MIFCNSICFGVVLHAIFSNITLPPPHSIVQLSMHIMLQHQYIVNQRWETLPLLSFYLMFSCKNQQDKLVNTLLVFILCFFCVCLHNSIKTSDYYLQCWSSCDYRILFQTNPSLSQINDPLKRKGRMHL